MDKVSSRSDREGDLGHARGRAPSGKNAEEGFQIPKSLTFT